MTENDRKRAAACPLCGKVYRERPAISRTDNGTREALSALGVGADAQLRILAAGTHGIRT